MKSLNILILISALLLPISLVRAGAVKFWTPKELIDRSEVVIIGRPILIEDTGRKGSVLYGEIKLPIPTDIHSAKIEIIQVIKGEKLMEYGQLKVKELAMTFSKVGETKLIDTQYVYRIDLSTDRLFLMYLNSTEDGSYLSALEGEVDDYQAAKPLILKAAADEGTEQSSSAPDSNLKGKDKKMEPKIVTPK